MNTDQLYRIVRFGRTQDGDLDPKTLHARPVGQPVLDHAPVLRPVQGQGSGWVALNERAPTLGEADENGDVYWFWRKKGEPVESVHQWNDERWDGLTDIHWHSKQRTPEPPQLIAGAEETNCERAAFENWWLQRCGDTGAHKTDLKSAMFDAWQAAGKEAK